MTVLLDTHVLLWALSAPERIPERERDVLEDGANRVLYSAASVWEIAINQALGRATFGFDAATIALEAQRVGFSELPVLSWPRRVWRSYRRTTATLSTGCWLRRPSVSLLAC
jgi:PIN domain nuclease of toxin-antitoxin system